LYSVFAMPFFYHTSGKSTSYNCVTISRELCNNAVHNLSGLRFFYSRTTTFKEYLAINKIKNNNVNNIVHYSLKSRGRILHHFVAIEGIKGISKIACLTTNL